MSHKLERCVEVHSRGVHREEALGNHYVRECVEARPRPGGTERGAELVDEEERGKREEECVPGHVVSITRVRRARLAAVGEHQ